MKPSLNRPLNRSLNRSRILPAHIGRVLFGVAAFLLLSAQSCDPIIEDSGFDIWCDGEPCRWEVEQGDVAQAPTWHKRDHGVELLGDPAAISQLQMESHITVDCIRFDLLADIEETASVVLEMDFYDDGEVEFSQIIPTSDWAPLSYVVTPPAKFEMIRFRIRKTGSGRAVLADITAEDTRCTNVAAPRRDMP